MSDSEEVVDARNLKGNSSKVIDEFWRKQVCGSDKTHKLTEFIDNLLVGTTG